MNKCVIVVSNSKVCKFNCKMDSDYARINSIFPLYADVFAYNEDENLNTVIGFNLDHSFPKDRPIPQIESFLSFLISQFDFELFRKGITDRRTQESLGIILGIVQVIFRKW